MLVLRCLGKYLKLSQPIFALPNKPALLLSRLLVQLPSKPAQMLQLCLSMLILDLPILGNEIISFGLVVQLVYLFPLMHHINEEVVTHIP